MKVAIIGAGPSGLAAANEFSKNGIQVDVYENDDTVGGLAKSISIFGQSLEMGPHFLLLHTQNEVKQLLEDLLQDDVYKYDRLSRIYLDDKYYDYPPRPMNIFKNMGAIKTTNALFDVLAKKISPAKDNKSVASYMQNNLGNYMYNVFFKGYTEKLWNLPCEEITDEYAKTLIGLDTINVQAIFKKLFNDKNSSLHRQCIYPKNGMSLIWSRLKDRVEQQGGRILTSTNLKGLIVDDKHIKGVIMPDGEERIYDYVFSSIPEAAILRMLPNVPKELTDELRQIQFRRVILVYLQIEHTSFIEDNTVYIYNDKINAARITNYNRFKNIEGNDIIMCEYWTGDKQDMWKYTPEEMLEVAKKDLKIFNSTIDLKIIDYKVVQMKSAYPVPDMKLKERKISLGNFLNTYTGLVTLGRANQVAFNFSMEKAMMEGIIAAKKVIQNA